MNASAVLGYFKDLFSRAFWFGSFLPLAIFASVNLVLAWRTFPAVVKPEHWLSVTADNKWTALSITVVVLVVLTYAVSPLVKVVHGILVGTMLPDAVHDFLRQQRSREMSVRRQMRDEARDRLIRLQRLTDNGIAAMGEARQAGQLTQNNNPSPALADVVIPGLVALESILTQGGHVALNAVETTLRGVEAELRLTDARNCPALRDAQRRMISVLWDARRSAGYHFINLRSRWRGLALNEPRATRIGDARATVQRYTADVYNADFDYVWPRIQLAMSKDTDLRDRILAAEGQVDFAALSLALLAILPMIWIPLLAVYATSVYPLLIMGAVVPVVALVLYEVLFSSEIAFGAVVKVVVDRYRLDLLTLLKQPLPATLGAERQMWGQLSAIDDGVRGRDLRYRHTTQGQS
jgi:hypothetical protein